MPFGFSDVFIAKPLKPVPWQQDTEKKRLFGLELAKKDKNPFECACLVLGDASKGLWASVHWLNDPVVIAARVEGSPQSVSAPKLLDKEALALKLLSFADEKIVFNGNEVYAAEAKDRLSALKLYADIQGFTKQDALVNNNFVNNTLQIRFVEPDKKEEKIINHIPQEKEEDILENSPVKLKLVG